MGRHLEDGPEWSHIKIEYEAGTPLRKMADRFGKSIGAIRYRADKERWSKATRGRQGPKGKRPKLALVRDAEIVVKRLDSSIAAPFPGDSEPAQEWRERCESHKRCIADLRSFLSECLRTLDAGTPEEAILAQENIKSGTLLATATVKLVDCDRQLFSEEILAARLRQPENDDEERAADVIDILTQEGF